MDQIVEIYAERRRGDRWEALDVERGTPGAVEWLGSGLGDLIMQGLSAVLLGDDATFIAEHESLGPPRGLPADVSPEVRAKLIGDSEDTFNRDESWLGLGELLGFDWEAPAIQRAMVSAHAAKWFGSRNDPFPADLPSDERYAGWCEDGVRVAWSVPHRALVGERFFAQLRRLEQLAAGEDTRLVLWITEW